MATAPLPSDWQINVHHPQFLINLQKLALVISYAINADCTCLGLLQQVKKSLQMSINIIKQAST